MIPAYRQRYNASFSEAKYAAFLEACNQEAGYTIDFRIAESPIFISQAFANQLLAACEEIIQQILDPQYLEASLRAVPAQWSVPGEQGRPTTMALDFAICEGPDGTYLPQLIELQGFPSLFCYQHWLAQMYRRYFDVPDHVHHLFDGLSEPSYLNLLKKWIINDHDPQTVVLMEIEPIKQKTRVDFELTKKYLGIDYVCISEVRRRGVKLFYKKNGKEVPIRRIYNRVIVDELQRRSDLALDFRLTDEVDVEWVCHPNWFFRISKFTLPFLRSRYVPHSVFVREHGLSPDVLHQYVLKPLFSFSGTGVVMDVTQHELDRLPDVSNYILQRKVVYTPFLQAPDGRVKAEVRMLFLWLPGWSQPRLVTNLVRLSRGKMIGVDYNKNFTWVGGSVAFFEM